MNKIYIITAAVMLFCLLVFPLAAISEPKAAVAVNIQTGETVAASALKTTRKPDKHTVKVYLKNIKKIDVMSVRDYIVGVVAEEMSASYEVEALKAQAVAAYTMLLYRQKSNADKDYDITDDYAVDQGFLTENERKKKWGGSFDAYEQKITKIVEKVLYQKITHDNQIIFAAYHAISGGKTESCSNIWGGTYPYLKPVESVADMLSPDYATTVTYTKDEFASLSTALGLKLKGDASKFVGEAETTDCGTVLHINLGGKKCKGTEVRAAFSLRSPNFDLSYSDGKFVFTVRGYGHGVGMSQYGANVMAQKGSDYTSILKYYYTGVKISE